MKSTECSITLVLDSTTADVSSTMKMRNRKTFNDGTFLLEKFFEPQSFLPFTSFSSIMLELKPEQDINLCRKFSRQVIKLERSVKW